MTAAKSVTLVGKEADIKTVAAQESVALDGITIIDLASSPSLEAYVQTYYEMKREKDQAKLKAGKPAPKPASLESAR
ncbi:MAG: hypothetical protein LBF60_08525 [Treponema sp.]|nr:hypothetical protein [Treponema sp.]